MNARFAEDPEPMLEEISKAAGMDREATVATLAGFGFPDIETQLSGDWLGGGLQTFLKDVADFFHAQGTLDTALDSYDGVVNASYLQMASEM
jgi:taurine transport system substrate-binding protein